MTLPFLDLDAFLHTVEAQLLVPLPVALGGSTYAVSVLVVLW